MNIKPIHNEKDYDNALDRVDVLMELNPALHTAQSDELEVLALLIEKYEEKAWAISVYRGQTLNNHSSCY